MHVSSPAATAAARSTAVSAATAPALRRVNAHNASVSSARSVSCFVVVTSNPSPPQRRGQVNRVGLRVRQPPDVGVRAVAHRQRHPAASATDADQAGRPQQDDGKPRNSHHLQALPRRHPDSKGPLPTVPICDGYRHPPTEGRGLKFGLRKPNRPRGSLTYGPHLRPDARRARPPSPRPPARPARVTEAPDAPRGADGRVRGDTSTRVSRWKQLQHQGPVYRTRLIRRTRGLCRASGPAAVKGGHPPAVRVRRGRRRARPPRRGDRGAALYGGDAAPPGI